MKSSAVHKNRLGRIVSSLDRDISTAVEIGTYRGLSTAVLVSLGIHVHTFDVVFQEDAPLMWEHLDCSEMVNYHVPPFCKQEEFLNLKREELGKVIWDESLIRDAREWNREVIQKLHFQFAFIDGQHTYEDCRADFSMVKRCGLVLFHDNTNAFPGVKRLAQEIGARSIGEFALWEG